MLRIETWGFYEVATEDTGNTFPYNFDFLINVLPQSQIQNGTIVN